MRGLCISHCCLPLLLPLPVSISNLEVSEKGFSVNQNHLSSLFLTTPYLLLISLVKMLFLPDLHTASRADWQWMRVSRKHGEHPPWDTGLLDSSHTVQCISHQKLPYQEIREEAGNVKTLCCKLVLKCLQPTCPLPCEPEGCTCMGHPAQQQTPLPCCCPQAYPTARQRQRTWFPRMNLCHIKNKHLYTS